jgi:predicted signal transduction protein with EAL and GGDEF domain
MKNKSIIAALLLLLAVSSFASDREKKAQRGMLESMQSVPCGAKERGVTGVGSVFASVGVAHVNSHEQLCPQYFLRTDEMDYHIRPADMKHAAVLPVGQEAEFRIKKDRLFLRVGDEKKAQEFLIVAMQPANAESKVEGANYQPPTDSRAPNARSAPPAASPPNAGADKVVDPPADHPPQQ